MILLVEDNEDDVFILERALKKLSKDVPLYNATNGRDALNYLQGEGKYSDRSAYPIPNLILLDLKLPFVHGFEVLTWILQQPELKDIPVAMLTSSPEDSDRDKAFRLGAKIYMVKPPAAEMLRALLEQIEN